MLANISDSKELLALSAVWNDLPKEIKNAIKAIVGPYKKGLNNLSNPYCIVRLLNI